MEHIFKYIFSISVSMLVLVLAWIDVWMIIHHPDQVIFLILINILIPGLIYLLTRFLIALIKNNRLRIRFKTKRERISISRPENRLAERK